VVGQQGLADPAQAFAAGFVAAQHQLHGDVAQGPVQAVGVWHLQSRAAVLVDHPDVLHLPDERVL